MATVKGLLGFIVSLAWFIQAVLYIPQLYRLWRLKEAHAVSLWFLFGGALLATAGVVQGYLAHKHTEMFAYLLLFVTTVPTALLAMVYRIKGRMLSKRRGY